MIELVLHLLDNEQLLSLFEKVVRERTVVKWPLDPNEQEQQAQLKHLHALLLSAGFDRHLANELSERDRGVRARLEQVRQQTGKH